MHFFHWLICILFHSKKGLPEKHLQSIQSQNAKVMGEKNIQ